MFTQVKLWIYAILGSVLAVLGFTSVYFKGKADKMKRERDTLKATVHAERTRKKIEKKEKRVLEENEREIRKKGKEENFEGFDNLTDSNDY